MAIKINGTTVIDDNRNHINGLFWENRQEVTQNYTISASSNAGTFGPITINNGITVTIPDGSVWTIV